MNDMQKETSVQLTAEAALRKLQKYGERFMSLFNDEEIRKPSSRLPKNVKLSALQDGGAVARSTSCHGTKDDATKAGTATPSKISHKLQPVGPLPPAAQPQNAEQQKRQKVRRDDRAAFPGREAPQSSSFPSEPDRCLRKKTSESAVEIDAIMRLGQKAKLLTKVKESNQGSNGKQASGAAGPRADGSTWSADVLKQERKLFMSHKASKVHEAVQARPLPAAEAHQNVGLSPEEFQKLQMEVEKFASGSLDKRSAKLYKARMLTRLGAKADTAPRTAASIGKGLAKVAAKRQKRALEEAIETGMVQRKGAGKKRRTMKAKNSDRGLMEAGPSFKNGVLRVKPLKRTRAESGKLRLPKGVM